MWRGKKSPTLFRDFSPGAVTGGAPLHPLPEICERCFFLYRILPALKSGCRFQLFLFCFWPVASRCDDVDECDLETDYGFDSVVWGISLRTVSLSLGSHNTADGWGIMRVPQVQVRQVQVKEVARIFSMPRQHIEVIFFPSNYFVHLFKILCHRFAFCILSFHPLSFCFGYRAAANPASSRAGAQCCQLWVLMLKSVEIRISCRYFADPEKFPACTKPDCLARYCHLPHSEDFKRSRTFWHFLCTWTCFNMSRKTQEWNRSRKFTGVHYKVQGLQTTLWEKEPCLGSKFSMNNFGSKKCGTTRRSISKEPGGPVVWSTCNGKMSARGHAASISNMDKNNTWTYIHQYTWTKRPAFWFCSFADFCRLCSFYHDAGSLMTRLRPNVVKIVELIVKSEVTVKQWNQSMQKGTRKTSFWLDAFDWPAEAEIFGVMSNVTNPKYC